MLELIIFLPLSFTIPTIFAWAVFEKADRKGWETLIPFYNLYVFLKIIQKPIWWMALLFFPFLNIFMYMLMLVELVKCFNKFSLWQQFLGVVLPFFYLPYLGMKKDEVYIDPSDRPKMKKSFSREWVDAIIFAVVAATIIRTFLLEAYTIPTSSMEKSLLVGDYLFVSKITYGPKVPNTPLSFPFVHHTLPGTKDVKSYVEWIKLPFYRFPGFKNVKHNDAVVFNYPTGDTVSTRFQSNVSYYTLVNEYGRKKVWSDKRNFGDIVVRPVDKKENYVKRCIGLPGDTLSIVNRQVYLNGVPADNPKKLQYQYMVTTDGSSVNPKILDKLDITETFRGNKPGQFVYMLTNEAKEELEKLSLVKKIEIFNEIAGNWKPEIFPNDSAYKWNRDNFGPLYIPKKDVPINLTNKNLPIYERLIKTYEGNHLEVDSVNVIINGEVTTTYTPKFDYYWMMGDNRHNSADSRYWGFVPEDHIVGRAEFTWLSLDPNKSLFDGKIRWDRLFSIVR
ncbi:MAG: signal peptidase I [Bacteroidetes bacterium]|nr:signal peptidase I [Bacteroidota bacterium]MBL6944287.1 signal peptidase I [Bacteroidales bacterium]